MIQGGLAPNIVPDECRFMVDMRCDDEERLDAFYTDLTERFRRIVEAGGGTLTAVQETLAPAVSLPEDHPGVQLAAQAARNLGFPVSCQFTGGCSDANFLCGMGLPSLLLATGMDRIHTVQERLALQDLYDAARWTLEIMRLAAAK